MAQPLQFKKNVAWTITYDDPEGIDRKLEKNIRQGSHVFNDRKSETLPANDENQGQCQKNEGEGVKMSKVQNDGPGISEEIDTPESGLMQLEWLRKQVDGWGAMGAGISDEGWGSLAKVEGFEDMLRAMVMDRMRMTKDAAKAGQRAQSATAEYGQLADQVHQLELTVEMKDQDLATAEARLAQAKSEAREQRRKWLEEKDGLEKKCIRLMHRDTQYQANLRKQEREYARLQDRMQRLSSQSDKSLRRLFDLSKTRPRPSESTGSSKSMPQAIVARLTASHMAKMENLETENEQLRSMLRQLQEELDRTSQQLDQLQEEIQMQNPVAEAEELSGLAAETIEGGAEDTSLEIAVAPEHFSMPVDWVEANIGETIHRKLLKIQNKMEHLRELHLPATPGKTKCCGVGPSQEHVKAIRMLKKELTEARTTIEEQDKVIREALFNSRPPPIATPRNALNLSQMCELEEEILHNREVLHNQQKVLEKERFIIQTEAQKLADDTFELEKFRAQLIYGDLHMQMAGALHSTTPIKTPKKGFFASTPLSPASLGPDLKLPLFKLASQEDDLDPNPFSPMINLSPVNKVVDTEKW